MCSLWIGWVLKPYERTACGNVLPWDPRGDFPFFFFFPPSTEWLGLNKICPQTLARSWTRLVVQRQHRFMNRLPRICRAECAQRLRLWSSLGCLSDRVARRTTALWHWSCKGSRPAIQTWSGPTRVCVQPSRAANPPPPPAKNRPERIYAKQQPMRPDASRSSTRAPPAAARLRGVLLRGPNFGDVLCFIGLSTGAFRNEKKCQRTQSNNWNESVCVCVCVCVCVWGGGGSWGWRSATLNRSDAATDGLDGLDGTGAGGSRSQQSGDSHESPPSLVPGLTQSRRQAVVWSASGLTGAQVNTWLRSSSWSEGGVVAVAWFQVQG